MIKIITDSTCDLSIEEMKQQQVEVVPLTVHFGEEQYRDKLDITNEEFYEKLKVSQVLPTTSLVSPEEFFKVFQQYPEDDLVVIMISTKLSGTCQSAFIAKEMTGRENIYIVDSLNASVALGLLVKQAIELKSKVKSAKELYLALEESKKKIVIFAAVDTLEYLVKGGRLGRAAGTIGKVLNIKLLLTLVDGKLEVVAKHRGMQRALKDMIERYKENCSLDLKSMIMYAHTGAQQRAESLRDAVGKAGDIYCIGSVVGAHSGLGCIAIAYSKR